MKLLKRLSALLAACCVIFAIPATAQARFDLDEYLPEGEVEPNDSFVAFLDRPAILEEIREADAPRPVLVLLERNPWLMVIGSDSPSFALYDDRTVIYRDDSGYHSVALSEDDYDDLLRAVAEIDDPASSGFYDVAALITDQPTNHLLLYLHEPVYISVYGSLNSEAILARLPEDLRTAIGVIRSYRSDDAEPWLPDYLEVMLWDYSYAPEDSIIWPEDWPGLDDPNTQRWGEDSYSIYVPSSEREALMTFLRTRNERGAIELDGHKFSASVRYPFVGEALWMP